MTSTMMATKSASGSAMARAVRDAACEADVWIPGKLVVNVVVTCCVVCVVGKRRIQLLVLSVVWNFAIDVKFDSNRVFVVCGTLTFS